jgi:hypothetical protein
MVSIVFRKISRVKVRLGLGLGLALRVSKATVSSIMYYFCPEPVL